MNTLSVILLVIIFLMLCIIIFLFMILCPLLKLVEDMEKIEKDFEEKRKRILEGFEWR